MDIRTIRRLQESFAQLDGLIARVDAIRQDIVALAERVAALEAASGSVRVVRKYERRQRSPDSRN